MNLYGQEDVGMVLTSFRAHFSIGEGLHYNFGRMWTWTITDYVHAGNQEGVIKRLDAGDFIDERRLDSYTPLIYTAYYNKCQMIHLLLDRGADIEAIDKFGLSALRTAIYYRNEEAAILLASRGADANKRAYHHKTTLHTAVKNGQLPVVRALLLNGTDLTIESASGKTAFGYITGTNADEFMRLLTSFVSLKMAIKTENSEAVAVLLKKTLSERSTTDDAVHAYKTATIATAATEGNWQVKLLELVKQFELDMLNRAARSGSLVFVDAVYEAIGKPEWISTKTFDLKGWNILHVTANLGHVNLVNHLLTTYDCDSRTLDFEKKKAIDLVDESEDDNSKHIHCILSQHEKKTIFMELSSQLLLQNESTAFDLHELPRYIYELRTLYYLACGTLTTDEIKTLLESAFTEAVQAKLMFDDNAAVFFKVVLRECVRLGLISKERKDFWNVQARHVNMENAEWVREIQNSLVRLEHRVTITERNISSLNQNYNMLRNAIETKIRLDGERTRRRRLIGLVTAGICFCSGPSMEGALNWAFDLCATAEGIVMELTDISSEELSSTLSSEGSTHVLKPRIQALLEQACIDKTEFKDLLKEAVALEKADITKVNSKSGTESTKRSDSSREQPTKPKFHFRDVVQMVTRLDQERRQQKKTCMLVDYSHLSEADLEAHPYHYVVFYSSGSLNEFKQLVEHIGDADGDVDATMEIQVPENPGSVTHGEQGVTLSTLVKIQATAATYASYLGYIDIVDWLLRNGPPNERNTRIAHVLINRARNINKRLQPPMQKGL